MTSLEKRGGCPSRVTALLLSVCAEPTAGPSASIAVLTACRLGAPIFPPRCGDGERLATVRTTPLTAGSARAGGLLSPAGRAGWSRSSGTSGDSPSRGSMAGSACGVGGRAGSHVPVLTMSAVGSANRATRVARFSCSAAPSGATLSAEGDRSRFSCEGERGLERALSPTAPGGRAASDGSACTRAHGTTQRRLVVTAVLSLSLRATAI